MGKDRVCENCGFKRMDYSVEYITSTGRQVRFYKCPECNHEKRHIPEINKEFFRQIMERCKSAEYFDGYSEGVDAGRRLGGNEKAVKELKALQEEIKGGESWRVRIMNNYIGERLRKLESEK